MSKYVKTMIALVSAFIFVLSGKSSTIEIDNIEYEYTSGTGIASLKKVPTDYVGGISVPETVVIFGTEYTITEIANNACKDCKKLTLVILPNTIVRIGNNAFNGCINLESCNIPESVQEIGGLAFSGCKIAEVNLPRSLTKLGSYAFMNCPIKDVFIPNTLTTIEKAPFEGCSALETITVEDGNPNYDSRNNCNALIETASNKLIQGSGRAFVPIDIVEIGESAFVGNTVLEAITIPASVKKIGNDAFEGCENLWLVVMNEGLEEIGVAAFSECRSLESIHIPSTVKLMQYETRMDTPTNIFVGCTGLESITVAEENEYYDSRNNCNAIIRKSDNKLMSGCKSTIIPETISGIAFYAFKGCTTLTSIEIPGNISEIGSSAFYGCTRLESVKIGEGVVTIKELAFGRCTSLSSVEFSETVKTIEKEAFKGCSSIKSLTIPKGVKYIGKYAFQDCYNMEILYLHICEEPINDGGMKIDKYAFATGSLYNDPQLTTVYCFSEKPFYIDNQAFVFGALHVTLYVPTGSSELYRNDTDWFSSFDRFTQVGWTRSIAEFDATDIKPLTANNSSQQVRIFSLDGKRLEYPQKGVNIIKESDGSSRKVIVR